MYHTSIRFILVEHMSTQVQILYLARALVFLWIYSKIYNVIF